MRRPFKPFLFLSLFLFTLPLFAKPFVLVQASDTHFITPELVESYDYLKELALVSDGKDLHQTHLILENFIQDMLLLHPDAILISGDLTLNGEKESHQDLSKRLRVLLDAGIPVYVITGNHDVKYTPYRFTEKGAVVLEKCGGQFFEDTWWDYGFGGALYQDDWSNSYIAELDEKLWLVALDSNTGVTGSIRTTTLSWLEEHLKEAKKKGITVISTTHQNLFVHNERFTYGYTLNNAKDLVKLYSVFGVQLNLSGHLHIQHIVTEAGITEITTSSLVDSPLQYGVVTIEEDKFHYESRELSNPDLQKEAAMVFDACTTNKLQNAVEKLPEEDKEKLLHSAELLNRGYFKGAFEDLEEDVLALWNKYPEISFGKYLLTIYQDSKTDYRHWSN